MSLLPIPIGDSLFFPGEVSVDTKTLTVSLEHHYACLYSQRRCYVGNTGISITLLSLPLAETDARRLLLSLSSLSNLKQKLDQT